MVDRRRDVAALFDRAAPNYGRVGQDFFGYFGSRLVRLAEVGPGCAFLDVGCGSGALLVPAAASVGNKGLAVGVDVSREMLAQVRQALGRASLTAAVTVGDAQRLPFRDGLFDVVGSSFAFTYFSEPIEAAIEMRRVLRSGGAPRRRRFGRVVVPGRSRVALARGAVAQARCTPRHGTFPRSNCRSSRSASTPGPTASATRSDGPWRWTTSTRPSTAPSTIGPTPPTSCDEQGRVAYRALWSNQERVLRDPLRKVAERRWGIVGESETRVVPMMTGMGKMYEVLSLAGPVARRDVARKLPPMYGLARLAATFRTLPPFSRAVVATALAMGGRRRPRGRRGRPRLSPAEDTAPGHERCGVVEPQPSRALRG